MNTSKAALIAFNALFLVIGIGAGVVLLQEDTSTQTQATIDQNRLFMDSQATTLTVGEHFAVSIKATSEGLVAHNAHISLSFDPEVLEATSATPGSLFPKETPYTFSYDNGLGTAEYDQRLDASELPVPVDGTIGSIIFKVKTQGTAKITMSDTSSLSIGDSPATPLTISSTLAIPIR